MSSLIVCTGTEVGADGILKGEDWEPSYGLGYWSHNALRRCLHVKDSQVIRHY